MFLKGGDLLLGLFDLGFEVGLGSGVWDDGVCGRCGRGLLFTERSDAGLSCFYFRIEVGKLSFLVVGRELDVGRLEASVEVGAAPTAGFGIAIEVVEEGIHLVEVLLGDGIVFVVVADGAAEGEAHEGGADGGDAVDDVFEVRFLRKGGATINDEVESVEAGGDELFPGGVLVEVAGDLELGKLVVGEVLIEGLDDPVAVGRVVAEVVVVVAVCVGDADEVEPELGHVLAVCGLCHEAVGELGVGVG